MKTNKLIDSFKTPETLRDWLSSQLRDRAWSLPDEPIYQALNHLNEMRRSGSRASVAHDVIQGMCLDRNGKIHIATGPGLMAVLNWLYQRK
jgi:hypothetical protein